MLVAVTSKSETEQCQQLLKRALCKRLEPDGELCVGTVHVCDIVVPPRLIADIAKPSATNTA